jgi:DNA topoisomerase-2
MTDLEKSYVKLSPIEHILKKPGMYVGSLDFRTDKQYIYNNIIEQKEINWSPGLYKIIDELIVNSYDQTIRDKTVSMIKIETNMNEFSIYNNGIGIDIAIHPIYKIYIPELIFANLLTSTNYNENEERITGGTHGLGAKLTAIFSKSFILEVWDSTRKLYYKQIYSDNLSKISKPTIEKMKEKKGGVKITIIPDFEKFKTDKFSPDMLQLINKRCVDLSGLVNKNVTIYLNDIKLTTGFNEYLKYYYNDDKWIVGNCVKNTLWNFAIRSGTGCVSFVNGINTTRGGKHVDYIVDILFEKLHKIVGKELTKKHIIDNLFICLNVSIINPTFNSQSKEELNTPVSKWSTDGQFVCNINEAFWSALKSSGIIETLKNVIISSNMKILSKLDGSKKGTLKNLPKLEDANFAGTKKSPDCTIILTEGDSAKATAISGISAIKDGRNYYGVYPLRGKLLNVRDSSTSQINANQEISDLRKIMGLKSGTIYTKNNISELRYGSIMIMTDADEDGSHIKGLILNFIDYFFPSLLEIEGFVKVLVTPLVKATNKNIVKTFSNLREYKTWLQANDNKMWIVKYYKGLGTSTSKEAGEYFQNITNNTLYIKSKGTKEEKNNMLLAFSKDKINDRKIWLNNYNPEGLNFTPPQTISIKEFINMELIHFSNYDNLRSIPSIMDGFKPSQRKVLFACLKRNLTSEVKIAQLAAYIAEVSSYHHGEQSLVSTVINMAQNYVGSNNLNLLVPMGQLGTRLMGGKDHSSARYIFTYMEKYVSKIFNKMDSELLEYMEDDGDMIEPKFYLPIIPLILVNGSEGIGTGFSTNIPNYNIIDIINYLKNRLTTSNTSTSKTSIVLKPYYRNFKGNIIKISNDTYVTTGLIEIDSKKNILTILELPVKLWTNDYKEFLETLLYENNDKIFKQYTNLSSDIEVRFILSFSEEMKETIINMNNTKDESGLNRLYKYLHLYKTIKESNMTLYDMNSKIRLYKNPNEIIDSFYDWRLSFYDKRKTLQLNRIEEENKYLTNQIKFIELVIGNKTIFNMNDIEVEKYLQQNKITKVNNSYDYLLNMSFKQLSKINLDKLENKLKENKKLYKIIKDKTNKQLWLEDLEELVKNL